MKFINEKYMKTNEDWSEIVDTLRPYLNGNSARERHLRDVENCLRFLGWKKTNGTMRSRSTSDEESGKPAITLLKREGNSGWQAFPVMTESPDGMTYATGLYIRENIRLYYRPDSGTGIPVCVLTAEFRGDDTNGPLLCALLSCKEFDLKSVENFCLRRYNLMRTGGSFRQWVEDFLSESSGTGNIIGLLRERFMSEGFEESLIREELEKLGLRVRYEKGHAVITLRYPE